MKKIMAVMSFLFFSALSYYSLTLFAEDTKIKVPGPVAGSVMSEEYAKQIGKLAYFWAWPMVNLHNRVTVLTKIPEPGLNGGAVPVAPPNYLSMLSDYITPDEKMVACPNQDVVYGFGIMTLDKGPVVIQVPEFKNRFWVYQLGDQRTDSFAKMGSTHKTRPGLYMIVGPDWKGKTPSGIRGVFHSPTNISYFIPRVFMNDTGEDRMAIQQIISQINMYPLSKYNGRATRKHWATIPSFPVTTAPGEEEVKWVQPLAFFDALPHVMAEVQPRPGEEALYANILSVLEAAKKNEKIRKALDQAAVEADRDLVAPLFQFSNFGIPVANNWNTIRNGANFGTDYLTRTAVAKSNIFVNLEQETKYFYADRDSTSQRLNGTANYTMTFAKGELPPVKGFWSVTLYNKHHFFFPNRINRYSLGTKNKDLVYNSDGSLTLYIQQSPPDEAIVNNWLPAPADDFSLYIRAYEPTIKILSGQWKPPKIVKAGSLAKAE
ncbi:hypothetical protein D3C87_162490 [compost metagenome]